jgi:hypothetical protein
MTLGEPVLASIKKEEEELPDDRPRCEAVAFKRRTRVPSPGTGETRRRICARD